MKKTLLVLAAGVFSLGSQAFTAQQYHNDSAAKVLRGFQLLSDQGLVARGATGSTLPINSLLPKGPETLSPSTQQYSTRYLQYYHGIRVLDGEVTLRKPKTTGVVPRGESQQKVLGQLIQGIEIDPKELEVLKSPKNLKAALVEAKDHFFKSTGEDRWTIELDEVNLVIKDLNGKLKPLYEARFYATAKKHTPVLFHAFLDPQQENKVIKVWNDVMHYSDKGPGGNVKTQVYHYGRDGIPALNVSKKRLSCELNDQMTHVVVVNMGDLSAESSRYDWYMKPFLYKCQSETRDSHIANGAFSPADDAYFFGHLVQQLYQDWYQTKVLDMKTVTLRVHYQLDEGQPFENAFWDPVTRTMNFGDGSPEGTEDGMYPLVSIDVTGHEMSHGFTSAHSNLQYHDESGALNEAFSDMAGVATVAYLREQHPALYQAIYHAPEMNWSIGSAIMRNPDPKVALRYVDRPSQDGVSADCYKKIRGADSCAITYNDVVKLAESVTKDENHRQGIIVHLASGVYNKFFYNLANTPGWDVKKAFGLMLACNRDGYWGENTNFETAACQTLVAAVDLGYDTVAVKKAFTRVGINTKYCPATSKS